MSAMLEDVLTAAGILALLLIALEAGFVIGRRTLAAADPRAAGPIGAIQAAILGLLGLLLAFTYGAAGGRFLERQDLIVQEANAIGTAYLRADLLDEPHKSELRAALKRYTEHRIDVSSRLRAGVEPATLAEVERLHVRIWDAAIGGVTVKSSAIMGVLIPVNEVIDLHATRLAAGRKRLPTFIMAILMACSALAVGVTGYACGMSGSRRAPLSVALALLIAMALWITVDLDNPRVGLIQLSDAPLKALKFDRMPQ